MRICGKKYHIGNKTVECFNASHYNQCINYLKISGYKLAVLANFNLISLEYKRIIDSKKK
ncbi:GxxExxY protein [Gelidibacter salicanalis]|uniref:GxxExxY protein n=1 Tax=Gelidibacter salicanalis TaxID=291193 RepID=UPI001F453638|nr:GxxExxY protein [Gelidibacter salicanalis]